MPTEPTIPPNDPTKAPETGNVRDGSSAKRPPAQEGESKKSQFAGERNQPNTRPGEAAQKIKSSAGEE